MSQYMPLIAGASLHHGLPSLCKENDEERCRNNMIRWTTRISAGGRRARHRIDQTSPAGPVVAGGGTTCPQCARQRLPRPARPEGCYSARRSPPRGKAGLASQGNEGPGREVDPLAHTTGREVDPLGGSGGRVLVDPLAGPSQIPSCDTQQLSPGNSEDLKAC
jgi:hypothetical protein